jgi:geranylgeranyl reductase
VTGAPLSWPGILRLGLVQTALGAVVVLMTATINRVMIVELALPALVPGLLVASFHGVQILRPAWGHRSDLGGRRAPWIVLGMAALCAGGVLAALGTALTSSSTAAGLGLAALGFLLVGAGAGAAGTNVLATLAARVAPQRRAAAATVVWLMMIFGFALTAPLAGRFLDPYSPVRLVAVAAVVSAAAFALACVAVFGVEAAPVAAPAARAGSFGSAFRQVWRQPAARRFTIFVFVSMLAYSAEELLIEPFAGLVFGLPPGVTTKLAGLLHGGSLGGMILVAVAASAIGGPRLGDLRLWTVGGCLGSALGLAGLAATACVGSGPLAAVVFALGFANGVYAAAAIAAMMGLAAEGGAREGVRMGLWGAAQALALGAGGLAGAALVDLARAALGAPAAAYALVFGAEAVAFLASAWIAGRLEAPRAREANMVEPLYDVIVVGGGPAGAAAAADLARAGRRVALLDKAGRIKPCGGAIPPRLIRDFAIPPHLLKARVSEATMVSPKGARVSMPIEGGYVGMVDRAEFDEFLRMRAAQAGAERVAGSYKRLTREADGTVVVRYQPKGEAYESELTTRYVIGADGALSEVGRQEIKGANRTPFVFAYHEIVATPAERPESCEIHYRGALSPDFYAWIFPHGETMSVGVGSARKGFSLKSAVAALRGESDLAPAATIRSEGAPIPLKPLKRWDNGRDVVLAGDAAGVVAPASGEGIYYAMLGGRLAAEAVEGALATGSARALGLARKRFMKAHGRVFFILAVMQYFWYSSDKRRERFVSICRDPDVQRLTWEAYMNKELRRRDPLAHVRIFFKDLAHLLRVVSP